MEIEEQFYRMPKILMKADGYISKKTGEAVKLSQTGKLVYMYMLWRTEFFVDVLKGKHYESQATIAEACGAERKAVGAILKEMVEHKILNVYRAPSKKNDEASNKFMPYQYNSVEYITLIKYTPLPANVKVAFESRGYEIIGTIAKSSKKDKAQPAKPYIHTETEYDESDLPF